MADKGKQRKSPRRAPKQAARKPAKPAAGGRRKNRRPAPPRPRRWGRAVGKWLLVTGIWGAVGGLALLAYFAYRLPDISNLSLQERSRSVRLLDRSGQVFATFGAYHGAPLAVDALPPHLAAALVATEDRRFYDHFGIDVIGVARAAMVNLEAGRIRQGGSTLTQQLAKNVFLTPARTLERKVQEVLLALWLEARFSKAELLTIYLNRVYFGAGAYGVTAAADTYFGKSARALTVPEAALLIGLLKAPSSLNPAINPKGARRRMAQVLTNMVATGDLDTARAARLGRRLPPLQGAAATSRDHHYFADWAFERALALAGPEAGDLIVQTTLDRRAQAAVEAAVRRHRAAAQRRRAGQMAVVVMAPDGRVRAMAGGVDYRASQFNRATQARRQPGSAFKPLVYLAALAAGYRPDSVISDQPITLDGWRPRNYDGRYLGDLSLRDALAQSRNAATVRLAAKIGRRPVVDLARHLGLTAPLGTGPSLSLGVSELSPLALAGLYAAFANGGRPVTASAIERLSRADGRVLYQRTAAAAPPVVPANASAALRAMLAAVVTEGTGRAAVLDRPTYGKTGTSQKFRDAWFAGFDARRVAVVWLGNDNGAAMDGVTGGDLPARVWADVMTGAGG